MSLSSLTVVNIAVAFLLSHCLLSSTSPRFGQAYLARSTCLEPSDKNSTVGVAKRPEKEGSCGGVADEEAGSTGC